LASPNQTAFAALILSIPVLMWMYWTRWNLFQLAKYLALWTPVMIFFGQRALRERNTWQAKRVKGGKHE